MANTSEILGTIIKNMVAVADNYGFRVIIPEGTEKGAAPVSVQNSKYTATFAGDKGTFKIEVSDKKIYLKCSSAQYESAVEEDFAQQSAGLFEEENITDKDIRYLANEFNETIIKVYGKNKKSQNVKLPTPVSKTAARSGSVYFDTVTLAARMTAIFPECKDAYKANVERFGEFLPEDFFLNHCNKYVIETIRENNPAKMKKLFNCLNEIYNDGTNEVQSIIVITILGSINNDEQLLANCVDYMQDMTLAVIEANKYLSKNASARQKLKIPPKYRPKRIKRKSPFMSQMSK